MTKIKDRHLVGGVAAACAVCCAAPIVGFLGIAGLAATAFSLAFAGVAFALVVAAISLGAVVVRRRAKVASSTCGTSAETGDGATADLGLPSVRDQLRSSNGV